MKNLIAISAPSGSGKTTLCRELQQRNPEIQFSVSCTTRPKRNYERDGYDYYFLTDEEFRELIAEDALVEYENVHGYFYGTMKKTVDKAVATGKLLLLEVDVKGAMSIKEMYPSRTITIFIMPPSIEELKVRLHHRGTDSEERIKKRMERLKTELAYKDRFDYVVVNDNINNATEKLISIINLHTKQKEC